MLERQRPERDEKQLGRRDAVLLRQRASKASAHRIIVRPVRFKLRVGPKRFDGSLKLLYDVRQVAGANLDHPFVARTKRSRGQIGRADIRRVQIGSAVEQPRLCV